MDKSIKSFAAAFRTHWLAAMSGGFSVPFTALAVFVDNRYAQAIFALLAFSAVWVAAFRIWKVEREKVIALEAAKLPKLKCSFDPNDSGCKRPNTKVGRDVKSDWYRVKVEAENIPIENCQGRLLEIKRGESLLFGRDKITLPFAYSSDPDATAKTVHPGVLEYLDFLAITYDNQIYPIVVGTLSGSVNWNDILSLAGDYQFRIAIISPKADSCFIDILIRWKLDHVTSEVVCLTQNQT